MPKENEFAAKIEHLLANSAKHKTAARDALALLFPKVSTALNAYTFDPDIHDQRMNFRIANKDFAASYFHLDPVGAHWGKDLLDQFFKSADPFVTLAEAERYIDSAPSEDKGKLRRILLEQLQSAFEKHRARFDQNWIDALVKFSPIYIKSPNDLAEVMFSLDFITLLEFTLMAGLSQLKPSERVLIFRRAASSASDITILCSTFRIIAGDTNPKGGANDRVSDADFGKATEFLRRFLVEIVSQIAKQGRLWEQADPEHILWFWWGADRQEEVYEFTRREMRTSRGAIELMKAAISYVRSTDGNYERVPHRFSEIADVQLLQEKAHAMLSDSPDEERSSAMRFLAALQRRER